MSAIISGDHLKKTLTYEAFKEHMIEQLRESEGLPPEECHPHIHLIKLNMARIRRLDRSIILDVRTKEHLSRLKTNLVWVVLVESWCGDVSQNLPVIARIAEYCATIDLKLLLRDQNLDVMDAYLTNGGRAIPKLICLEAKNLRELGTWGPRPQPAQRIMAEFKRGAIKTKEEALTEIQRWYNRDKGVALQMELLHLLTEQGML